MTTLTTARELLDAEDELGPSPQVSDREAAHLAGVSVETFRRWVRDGHAPPGRKIGPGSHGTVRWARDELDAWISDRPAVGSAA